ncbi:MAG: CarD family transcriptional regulator [Candidatus Sumerlaeia bacterium]
MANETNEEYKIDFVPGDTVVEPTIGICNVEGVRTMNVDGVEEDYFIFTSGKARVMVPKSQLPTRGIRKPMTAEGVKKIFNLLKMPVSPSRGDARQQYLNYRDIIKSGDPTKICKLIRELYILDETDELKGKEKEIMEQAMAFLVEEILFVTDDSKTKIRREIEECLSKMYKKKVDKDTKSDKDAKKS